MGAKQNIITALEELAVLLESERKFQAQKDKQIAPFERDYLAAIKPIEDKFAPKLNPVRERILALEKQIEFEIISTETVDGGLKLSRVENAHFIVEANSTARREVDAKTLFESVDNNKKDSQFWSCFSVLISKTEKFLGSRIDAIATVKRSWKVTIKAKQKL